MSANIADFSDVVDCIYGVQQNAGRCATRVNVWTAIRLASSRSNNFAADRRPGSSSK